MNVSWRESVGNKPKFIEPIFKVPVPMAFHSFGGRKRSSFGDYGHGPEGVRFYTRLKTITSCWPTAIRHGAELKMPVLG